MCDEQKFAEHAVTLLGGGPVRPELLNCLLQLAPDIVAADGGANHAHFLKIPVKYIVGDFDSLTNEQVWRKSGANLTQLDEQDTTDFEKCLYSVHARLYLGVGFIGGRLDHTLACLRTIAKHKDKTIILASDEEVVFRCPKTITLNIEKGDRVSLFPMNEVSDMTSKGLRWPIDPLTFHPSKMIGTSNEAISDQIEITVGSGNLLVILPVERLSAAIAAFDG